MPLNPNPPSVDREHLQWAYRFAIFWDVLALAVFGGGYTLATMLEVDGENLTLMSIMLGTLLVLNAIWQAAGLVLSRIDGLLTRGADRSHGGQAA